VSETFGDSVQTDCAMHRLNLCLSYGIGLKEDTENTTEINPDSGVKQRVTQIVTKGGGLPEGIDIKQENLRAQQLLWHESARRTTCEGPRGA